MIAATTHHELNFRKLHGLVFVVGCEVPELRCHGLAGSAKRGVEFDDDDAVRRPRRHDIIEVIQATDEPHHRLEGKYG